MDALLQYIALYRDHGDKVLAHAPEVLNRPRSVAYERLMNSRLPQKGDEGFPALSLNDVFAPDYGLNINRVPFAADPAETFRCGVPNISTLLALVVNDAFADTASLQRNLPEGVTVMSLAKAAQQMPDFIDRYYDRLASARGTASSPVSNLNTLFAQDGVFVHVKAGVRLEKPIQIVNIFNASAPFMGVRRLLIVMEPDSQAQILLCDHSVDQQQKYLSCQVAEIYLERGSHLDYYDLEESSPATSRVCELYAKQDEGSQFIANGTTLIGGITRNAYYIDLAGEHTDTRLAGMAVAAEAQIVDNATFIAHNVPKGTSDQMFKYILEDEAKGSFYGAIVVDEKAKFTKAYQSNRNILASADARMYTRPQLEIYCDEVKCSHGAAIGQLDANALFYMRSRGIPEAEAKMMLMQAFMADVIDTVSIPSLKSRLQQLVEYRLAGNRQLCADCAKC